MADETRMPEAVAREWLSEKGLHLETRESVPLHADLAAAMLGGLIHTARREAFHAGAEAEQRSQAYHEEGEDQAAIDTFAAARRLAVEGRSDG